jgi:hypothetical protein
MALEDGAGVDAAVAAVGRTRASAFAERVRNPAFALAWDEAAACEEAMIEARLIERAIAGLAHSADPAAARDAERVAMWILSGRSAERTVGTGKRGQQAGRGPAASERTVDPALDLSRADALLEEVAARIAAEEERL